MHLLCQLLLLGLALPNRKLRAGLFLKFYNWLKLPLKLSEPNPTKFPSKIPILLAWWWPPEAHMYTDAEIVRHPQSYPTAARLPRASYGDDHFSWIILLNPHNSWQG